MQPGTYRIGGWEKGKEWADIKLDEFWIAKYPITVAQFAPFVREGYKESARRFWTPNGWKWKHRQERQQPYNWGEKNFNGAEQPIAGVSWYEAVACCNWCNTQLQHEIPAGYELCLPTEAEWEAAAAFAAPGREHRTFPWGEQVLTPERAAYGGTWKNGPPMVGSHPSGAAPCGALDMVGTVWECTTSDYIEYPKQSYRTEKDFTTGGNKAPWRGGSWVGSETYVRCRARYWLEPIGCIDYGGFRVVVAPAHDR